MKLKFLLIGTSLSLISNLTYAQCSPAQSCTELGYKEAANKGGCLKCPFGNSWYCPPPKEEKAVLGECTGYAKNCKIGNILIIVLQMLNKILIVAAIQKILLSLVLPILILKKLNQQSGLW